MTDLPVWLQEIRDRVDKATPGPWETGKTYEYELVRDKSWRGRYPFRVGECAACSKGALVRQDDVHTFGQGHVHVVEDERLWYVVSSAGAQRDVAGKDRSGVPAQFAQHGVHYAEDAEFIAHSRTDVPRLVELVGEMAKALETCMPVDCYGGVAEHVEDCAECAIQDICERYEALRALAMYYGEEKPITPNEPYWWCPACECKVDASRVTYEEVHDVCGCPVEWRGEVESND